MNVTGLNIPENYALIYFGKSFYLHQFDNPLLYKINIEGNTSVEPLDNKYDDIDKNTTKVNTEVAKLNRSGLKIIGNFNKIGINVKDNLVFSGCEINSVYENTMSLYKNRFEIKIFAEQNKNKYTFPDGSEIITDSRNADIQKQ